MDENSKSFVHGRLVLEGNRFEKPTLGRFAIHLDYLAEANIIGNSFDAPYDIYTNCVGKVEDKNNVII
jgi:hypothetical protein